MRYAVYINRTRKRACWHREGCGYIKMHGGEPAVADQDWFWCDTPAHVHEVLEKEARGFKASEVAPCQRCRPDTGAT
ncbi:MAG: hypothetical protein H6811_04890 [Phycisphaeraceae bacterium]|nr:hypothetical protein [Phycisphaeraceae bacterium]